MRFIPTKIHGVIDYLIGLLLIAAPWIFGFADGSAAQWAPIVLGAVVIIYSLLTRYELGAADVIPLNVHLWLDVIGGVVLAASPWAFGFADMVWMPHLIIGVVEIVIALLTHTTEALRHTQVAANTR
ncbi:MAG TPA: SPW repeat protein [Caldilineaceae bacterium]|nr:SPW repeat protein [Caldilineaceae bacterium]